jgi:hypothetical protein
LRNGREALATLRVRYRLTLDSVEKATVTNSLSCLINIDGLQTNRHAVGTLRTQADIPPALAAALHFGIAGWNLEGSLASVLSGLQAIPVIGYSFYSFPHLLEFR